jgi:hypothetical protein
MRHLHVRALTQPPDGPDAMLQRDDATVTARDAALANQTGGKPLSAPAYRPANKPLVDRPARPDLPDHALSGQSPVTHEPNRKARPMKSTLILAMTLATLSAPMAFAMPAIGDIVGTNPEAATAALKTAGCEVTKFEAEDGKIEAKCTDTATAKAMEVYIDPKTGAVTDIKSED